jgi:2-oxoglutarate ferredoxin oxidoreductase subunit delta
MASGHIIVNEERCKGCELCIAACPPAVISLAGHLNSRGYRPSTLLDPEHRCTGCALCAVVCPDAAITVFRDLPLAKVRRPVMEVV